MNSELEILTKNEDNHSYKIFKYNFPSLISLANYLSGGKINSNFKNLASNYSEDYINCKSYEWAVRNLLMKISDNAHESYQELLDSIQINALGNLNEINTDRVKNKRSYVGSRPDIDRYLNGSPKNMVRIVRSSEKKVINFYFQLSYSATEKQKQIVNRGIIATQIIKILEKYGFCVNLVAFALDKEKINDDNQEYFYVTINLKDLESPFNEVKCYGPFFRVEFQKRILFRLLEITPVSSDWSVSYGYTVKPEEAKKMLMVNDNDIYFGTPRQLGIEGLSLNKDLEQAIHNIGMDDVIKLKKSLH